MTAPNLGTTAVTDGFGGEWERCSREDCDLHVVRPGKVQCRCEFECSLCGGQIEYHSDPMEQWPQIFGWFCSKCGPFPNAKEGK